MSFCPSVIILNLHKECTSKTDIVIRLSGTAKQSTVTNEDSGGGGTIEETRWNIRGQYKGVVTRVGKQAT